MTPSIATPQFQECASLSELVMGGVVHLFVVYGYQGAEEDSDKLVLTDKLLQAVLAGAQVVHVGQPLLVAGDLNAAPAVIPCLAKGMSAGRYVDLALAYSQGAGVVPDRTCTFNRDDGSGSRRDFFVGCPNALAASQVCCVTDKWFTPHYSLGAGRKPDDTCKFKVDECAGRSHLLSFVLIGGLLRSLAPCLLNRFGLHVGLILLIGLLLHLVRYRMPVCLFLGMSVAGQM